MKQNPRQLINEVREQVSRSDTDQKILSNYSTDPELWGYSKVWLFFLLLPAMGMARLAASVLTGEAKFYGYVASIVLAVLGVGIALATPSSMDIERYLSALVSHRAHQQTMIHDSDPDESRLAQPTNDSLLGRIARLPLVRHWPLIGAGEYAPTQDLVVHERPYRGEYAIQRDDGGLIAAIRVFPIPLRLESDEAKRKVERAVADALEVAIEYDAQWYSPQRVADFSTRRQQWSQREQSFRDQASTLSRQIDVVRKQTLADLCGEKAAIINLHEDTKQVREYYILVSVDAGEGVTDRSAEKGGLGSIPGVGHLVEKKRLRDADVDDQIETLIRKLERRVNNLTTELNRVENISTQKLSAIEFSEQIADYYRGVNVRDHDDFSSCVRSAPVPNGQDAGDPEHDTSYGHITNRERGGAPSDSLTAPDGGLTTAPSAASQADTDATAAASAQARALNDETLVGGVDDADDLSWRYKSLLAPDSYSRQSDHGIIDDEYYTQTLEIRDWPAVPTRGFLDPLSSFTMPGVDLTLSTHLTGEDSRQAERELAEAADSIKDKVRSFAKSKWVPELFTEKALQKFGEVKSVQQAVSNSEYGLYSSQTFLEVRAPSTETLDTAVSRIRSRLQDSSADAKPLKHNHRLGYRTVAPACQNYVGGNTKMTGDGLARLIPWTARNLLESGGIELGLNEHTGDPIVLNLMNRETGFNVGFWGNLGAGKTITMTRVLLHSKLRNPDMPVVIIDPLQEFEGLTWLFDGDHVVVGSDTGINVMQIDPIPPEQLRQMDARSPKRQAIRRVMDFVRSYYEYMGIPFGEKQGTWRTAVKEAYARKGITDDPTTHDRPSPTLRDVFAIFEDMVHSPEDFLRAALADVDHSKHEMKKQADAILRNDIGALDEGGEFEHLSKPTDIDVENIDVLYLDLQQYENKSTAGLMMGPLLSAIYSQARDIDEPMLFGIDEFHYMLRNSSSLETLKQMYRHSRHSDISIMTATQSVSEFFAETDNGSQQLTKSAQTLTKLMSVQIFHYLKEMNDDWAEEFGLSDDEQEFIANADTGDPTAEALLRVDKEGSFALDVQMSDELNPREFAVAQYDPTDHGDDVLDYLANYTDQNGNDVTEWTWDLPSERPDLGGEPATSDPTVIPDAVAATGDAAPQTGGEHAQEVNDD
jgi:hypothetical protein